MNLPRIIPCLLIKGAGFVKTERFSNPVYLGDPRNILKIFNAKEADEIVILDITASKERRGPNIDLLTDLASECFMPAAYGGGVTSLADAEKLFRIGYEKVVLNTALFTKPILITEIAARFGSQSVVVCIDAKKKLLGGYGVFSVSGSQKHDETPVQLARRAEELGAGEIIVQSMDRDGTFKGYDLELVRSVAESVGVPVVALGGASSLENLIQVLKDGKASAAGAGSLFVFHGRERGILVNVPKPSTVLSALAAHPA